MFQINILNLRFKFPTHNREKKTYSNVKLRILIWSIYFGNVKNTSQFLKKATFSDPKRFSYKGQNNIGGNMPIFIFQDFQMKFLILVYWEKGEKTFAMTYKSICRFLEKFHDATNEVTLHVGLGSCMNLFGKGKNFRFLPFAYWSTDII